MSRPEWVSKMAESAADLDRKVRIELVADMLACVAAQFQQVGGMLMAHSFSLRMGAPKENIVAEIRGVLPEIDRIAKAVHTAVDAIGLVDGTSERAEPGN